MRKYDHISSKIKELGWLNMANRRHLHLICYVHKLLSDTSQPSSLRDKFVFRAQTHSVNIRNKNMLVTPKFVTALFQRSFSYNAIKAYNNIPDEIKNLKLTIFKERVKVMLLNGSL